MRRAIFPILIAIACLCSKIALDKTTELRQGIRTPDSLPLIQAGYHGASLKRYATGFDNLIAATIWIQLLQKADHTPVKSDSVSWEFAQLDAITELDPKFDRAYDYGSIYLAIFRRDKIGGKTLLEKWAKRQPHFWRAQYMLGLHHLMQLKDREKAGELLLKASQTKGAPAWLSSLGIRLVSESGELLQAIKLAIELWPSIHEPNAKERLTFRIRSLNFGLQKQSLKDALKEYEKIHKARPTSIAQLAPMLQTRSRELASAFQGQSLPDPLKAVLRESFAFRWDSKSKEIVAQDPVVEEVFGKLDIYETPANKEE